MGMMLDCFRVTLNVLLVTLKLSAFRSACSEAARTRRSIGVPPGVLG